MNWSHALLVVAIASIVPSIVLLSATMTNWEYNVKPNIAGRWLAIIVATGLISGALAAGLWR